MTKAKTDTTKTIEARTRKAAEKTGEDAGKIERVVYQVDKIRRMGVLVDIDVMGAGMFSRRATRKEWGVVDKDDRADYLSGGERHLIPTEYQRRINSLASRARQLGADLGYTGIEGVYPWTLILFCDYADFRARWDAIAHDWAALKRELIANRDSFADLLAAKAEAGAARAWKAAKAQRLGKGPTFNGQTFTSESDFVAEVVGHVVGQLPTVRDIRSRFVLEYRVAIAELQSSIERMIQNDAETAGHYAAASEAVRKAAEAEAAHKREIFALEMEHTKHRLEEFGSPIDALADAALARVEAIASNMLASVERNGFVRGKIASQAGGLVELLGTLAQLEHESTASVMASVRKLEALIGPVGAAREGSAPRDVGAITATLTAIIDSASKKAEDVAATGRFALLDY